MRLDQAVGVRDVAWTNEHRRAGDHPSVDQLDTCQPVVVDHQPGDFAGHNLDAAGFELGPFYGGELVRPEATA
jgi:hypothetical protein